MFCSRSQAQPGNEDWRLCLLSVESEVQDVSFRHKVILNSEFCLLNTSDAISQFLANE